MKKTKLYVTWTMGFILAILSLGCGGGSGDGPYIHGIAFDPESPVPKGSDVRVTADVEGSNLEYHWTVEGGILRSASVHQGQAGSGMPEIAVTPPGHDDIGHALEDLGLEYDEINLDLIDNSGLLQTYDAVFINSSDEISVVGTEINLLNWVNDGGALYTSGRAADYLIGFDLDSITFAEPDPYVGSANSADEFIYGKVTDKSMEEATGISLVNLGYPDYEWTPVINIDWPASTLLEADASWVIDQGAITNLPTGYNFARTPVVVTIPYGEGEILYTSVHDHSGMNASEIGICYYLAARTAAWPIKRAARELIQYSGFYPYLDFIAVISEEQVVEKEFESDDFDDVMLVLNAASGVYTIEVDGPGDISEEYTTPVPVSMVFTDVEPGEWKVTITAEDTNEIEMVPYVLSIGYRSDSVTIITQEPEVIWTVPSTEEIYTINLRVIDNDFRTYDFLAGVKVE